jgi:uncharacterized protein (AIM24 family)
MKGAIFNNLENTANEQRIFVQQNDYTLLANLSGTVYATQGSMVAYKGDIDFDHKGAGLSRLAKTMATGESLPLMKITGSGDVYLANSGRLVHIIDLEEDELTIASRNVLAFTEGIDWDIGFMKGGIMGFAAGGLFNTNLKGSGSIAITSIGTPIVIPANGVEVFSDINSIIAWTTGLKVSIRSSFKAKSLIGLGSGESFQMSFSGQGYIIVQPGESIK